MSRPRVTVRLPLNELAVRRLLENLRRRSRDVRSYYYDINRRYERPKVEGDDQIAFSEVQRWQGAAHQAVRSVEIVEYWARRYCPAALEKRPRRKR